MTRLLLIFALAPAVVWGQMDTTRVLFLGNSYTFYNDLPQQVAALAASLDHYVEIGQNTPGGYSLQGHLSNSTTLNLIEQGDWDFVVLQEQSQKPALPLPQVEADFYPSAAGLVDLIREANPCAIPLFYMTWGRENGDASNCDAWPPVCTYEGMQDLLTERYLAAAADNEAACAPVGVVWREIFTSTGIDLYASDGSHPSAAGSYLAASTIFTAIFAEDPYESNYAGLIDFAVSQEIDQAVWASRAQQPEAWHFVDPCAETGTGTGGGTGAGTGAGTGLEFEVFPNPATDQIHVTSPHTAPLVMTIVAPDGSVVGSFEMLGGRADIDISDLASGVYVVTAAGRAPIIQKRVVVE
jgi:hypothetical protein